MENENQELSVQDTDTNGGAVVAKEDNSNLATTASENEGSYFDGEVSEYLGVKFVCRLIASLGITVPWAVCKQSRWMTSHIVINGKRMKFVGSPESLIGNWIKLFLIGIAVFAIYAVFNVGPLVKSFMDLFAGDFGGFFAASIAQLLLLVLALTVYLSLVYISIEKWIVKNTIFEDLSGKSESYFDGKFFDFLGVVLVCGLIIIFSLGFATPWAICRFLRWRNYHVVINGQRLRFEGTPESLIGNWIKWFLLSIVTLGIYSFWLNVAVYKWSYKNIIFDDGYYEQNPPNFSIDFSALKEFVVKYKVMVISIVAALIIIPTAISFFSSLGGEVDTDTFIEAAADGKISTVKKYIKSGGDVNASVEYFESSISGAALHYASGNGHTKVVQLLLENGADANTYDGEVDSTALMLASNNGHAKVMELLRSAGALDLTDVLPIVESLSGQKAVAEIKTLLETGNVNARNEKFFGATALYYAAQNGYTELANALLKAGANVDASSSDGWTALMTASYYGHVDTVELLLSVGADVHLRNDKRQTALSLASSRGHKQVVSMLQEAGA